MKDSRPAAIRHLAPGARTATPAPPPILREGAGREPCPTGGQASAPAGAESRWRTSTPEIATSNPTAESAATTPSAGW